MYIKQCVRFLKDVVQHEKFKDHNSMGLAMISNMVRKEKEVNPVGIPYYFTILEEFP